MTFLHLCRREALLYQRNPKLLLNGCLFFIAIIAFFPLTLAANTSLLQQVVPGLIWMVLLLAMLMGAESLFQADYDEGILEQWLISNHPLSLFIQAKLFIHWLFTTLPFILLTPIIMLLFHLSWQNGLILICSLVLGTPALLGLCALSAAFCIGMQQKGALMALILLPLTIPMLVFGSACLQASTQGLAVSPYLALIAAMSIITMIFYLG